MTTAIPTTAPTATLDALREHLQWAIELEHATLTPYLTALFSLDEALNPEATRVVRRTFMGEMLHLTLAANLLNAVGGSPVLDSPQLLPGYPMNLPHSGRSLAISLVPFGAEALDLFLGIEKPAKVDAPPESDGYQTIGQFYEAVEGALRRLCAELGESAVLVGDPARQIDATFPYGGSGRVIAVLDLSSALEALTEIVEQGEGCRAPRRVGRGPRHVAGR